jgi:hypothetical protein
VSTRSEALEICEMLIVLNPTVVMAVMAWKNAETLWKTALHRGLGSPPPRRMGYSAAASQGCPGQAASL